MRMTNNLLFRVLLSLVISGGNVNAVASCNESPASLTGEVVDVYQFSNNKSFIDNIAFRPDGTLLLTRVDVTEIWSIDVQTGTGSLVYDFSRESTKISSCFGIFTEIDHDVFTVVAGDFDVNNFSPTPGSFSVWELDFSVYHQDDDFIFDWRPKQTPPPAVTRVVDLPEAKALGASTLFTSRKSWYLLISDSPEGVIWRLDLETGESIQHCLMTPCLQP